MFRNILFLIVLIVTIIFCISLASNAEELKNDAPRNIIEDLVQQKLDAIKEQIPEPIAFTSPLQIPIIDIPDYIWANLTITNFYQSGLKALNLTHLNITLGLFESRVEFASLLIENLNLNLEYSNQFIMGSNSSKIIENNGAIKINLTEIVIKGNSGLNLFPFTFVKDVNSTISVGTAKFEITGIFNNDEVSSQISESLTKYFVQFIDEYQDQIAPVLNPIVEFYINNVFLTVLN